MWYVFVFFLGVFARVILGVLSGCFTIFVIFFLITAVMENAQAAPRTVPNCSWDNPGQRPFMGSVPDAVDRYTDIPAATRAKLKDRMKRRQYDEIAVITRDSIAGQASYNELRDMHFGNGQVCRTVSRAKWSPVHQERGLVYCQDGHCVIVPTVCRNVSRVTLVPPLEFDPPAAGVPPSVVPPGGNFTSPQPTPPAFGDPHAPPTFAAPTPVFPPSAWPPFTWIGSDPFPPVVVGLPPGVAKPPVTPPSVPPVDVPVPPVTPPGTPETPPTVPPVVSPPIEPPELPPFYPPITPPIAPPVPEPSGFMLMILGCGLAIAYSTFNTRKKLK